MRPYKEVKLVQMPKNESESSPHGMDSGDQFWFNQDEGINCVTFITLVKEDSDNYFMIVEE